MSIISFIFPHPSIIALPKPKALAIIGSGPIAAIPMPAPAMVHNKTSNFSFGNASGMDGSDTMSLNVVNSSPNPKEFSVFGENWKGNQPFGVKATVPQSSLGQATRESLFRGFQIKSMLVRASNPDQFEEPVSINIKSMTGQVIQYPLQLTNYQNPMNGNANLISLPDINIPVYGDVNLSGTVLGNTSITFTMKLKWLDGPQPSHYVGREDEYNRLMDQKLADWVQYMNLQANNTLFGRIPGGAVVIVN